MKSLFHNNKLQLVFISILFFFLTLIYLFPLTQGLILLPLDMLVSNYNPWYMPGQILVKNPYMQDSIIQLFPWRHLVFQSLQHGIIPFWNPYQFMGMPFMAGMKPMVFYPLNILFFLGETVSWNILLFLQLFLGMTFMYLLARSFKMSVLPSVLACFVFSLNTLMIGVLEFGSDGHVLIWLPLLILSAKQYLEKQKGLDLFILSITIAISIFAGQLQYTGYALLLLAAFIIYYGVILKIKFSTYLFLFVSIFLGIGISSIQLIPGIELFANSYRGVANSYHVFADGLNKPYQILRIFSPDFFGNPVTRDVTIGYIESIGYFGIIPLFFSIYAMIFGWKNIFIRFFTIIAIVSTLLAIQGFGQIVYLLHIPLVTSGEGDRVFSLVYLSVALLSAFGIMKFFQTKTLKRNIISLGLFIFLFIAVIAGTVLSHHSPKDIRLFLHNIQFTAIILCIFSLAMFIYLLLRKKSLFMGFLCILLIIGLTYLDLFRMGYRFLTFSNPKFLYPQMNVTKYITVSSKDTLARNIGLTEPELGTYLSVYTAETYNPLYLLRSAELLQALQKKPIKQLPMNKYFLTKGENLKYALDFLGVSLIVTDKDVNPSINFLNTAKYQNAFKLLYKDERYAVYKNTSAYSRFGLYYNAKVIPNDAEALRLISQDSMDFKKTLLINETLPLNLQPGEGNVKLISSNLNIQHFSIHSTKPALFYISDTYFPGWKAMVNNQKTKMYRANYNFRAVVVPAGTSMVTFTYLPSLFIFGIWISILSIICLGIILIWHKRLYTLLVSKTV